MSTNGWLGGENQNKGGLERVWQAFCEAIPDENWSDKLDKAAAKVDSEIADLEDGEEDCGKDHCDDHHEYDRAANRYVREVLDKIRLGVYDESLHGSLNDVLETVERRLGA